MILSLIIEGCCLFSRALNQMGHVKKITVLVGIKLTSDETCKENNSFVSIRTNIR